MKLYVMKSSCVVLSLESLREIGIASSESIWTTLCTYAMVLHSVNSHCYMRCEVLHVVAVLESCIGTFK